jgi:predicted metalloprotease with PDZ domain
VGHAFLLLPRVAEPLPVRVRIHPGALQRGADAASSFGMGTEAVTTATSEDLAHAVYVAGMLWREGGDRDDDARLVVLGDPPFDTRTAFDHAVAASAAVDGFFGRVPSAPEPFTFVLVAQPGLGGGREGAYLTRSLGIWFDARQALDGALDLVIAHELVHRFLGGSVRLVGRGGREAVWFSEGFTVHFARRVLLDAGLLSPAAFVADVNRTVGEALAGEERLPAEYRRGALYAAWFDAAIRHASRGRRSLELVVRELLAGGSESLPVTALRDALAHEIGPEGAAGVDRLEARDDTPVDLPDDAFGPCARRSTRQRKPLAGVKRAHYPEVGKKRETTWEVADCPAAIHRSR